MSKTLRRLIRARAREIHNRNVAISAAGDPTIDTGLAFQQGFRAPYPFSDNPSRRMRRAIERNLMKRLKKQGLA